MHRHVVRSAFIATLTGMILLLPASPAWAPHVPQLQVTPVQVQAGQEVTVAGTRGFGFTNPVEVRWNATDGPVLGTFQPANESYAPWGPGTVRIPAGLKAGTYYLWATQVLSPVEKHIRGVPSRAVVQVVGAGGAPALAGDLNVPGDRGTPGYERDEQPGVVPLALVGIGVAAVALLGAGVVSVAASKRRGQAAPAGAVKRS